MFHAERPAIRNEWSPMLSRNYGMKTSNDMDKNIVSLLAVVKCIFFISESLHQDLTVTQVVSSVPEMLRHQETKNVH